MWKRKFRGAHTSRPGRQRPSRRVRLVELTGLELLDRRVLPSTVVLVKDINVTGTFGSSPTDLTEVNGTVYFVANDGIHGRELWKTDGTDGGTVLVKDIKPGPQGGLDTGFVDLVGINGTLYFSADDGEHGIELWRSDGTEAGTRLVADIRPGAAGSGPVQLTAFGSTLFFSADDGIHGAELWKSDGTPDGTRLVKDINQGGGFHSSNPSELTALNGRLFFSANDGVNGDELWKSDGTEDGTRLVKDINPGGVFDSSFPRELTEVNGTLFFTADDGSHGEELWKSDGTPDGTMLVKDILPGDASSLPGELTALDGMLFFSADDGVHGDELWTSDGTPDGTRLVKDIKPGGVFDRLNSSFPRGLTALGGMLFFSADDGVHGDELWTSDGTPDGTRLVKDTIPGSDGGGPTRLTAVGETLFFGVGLANELWKSDGTPDGTVLVATPRPPSDSSAFIDNLTAVGGTLFFVTSETVSDTEGNFEREVWKSDGTAMGTRRVADVNRLTASSADSLVDVNGTLFFTADNVLNGRELWASDGTPDGTRLVKDINPGPASGGDTSDVATRSLRPGPGRLTNVDGKLFFVAAAPGQGDEPWRSDGTADGTFLVKDIFPGSHGSEPRLLTNLNGKVVFAAIDPDHGEELWTSDGTPDGTRLLKDINPGSADSGLPIFTVVDAFTVVDGVLFFTADDGVHGQELWRSDGTPDGTRMVKDITPGPEGTGLLTLGNGNGKLFFDEFDPANGIELWVSDGTPENTRMVKDINPGPANSFPLDLTDVGGMLFFTALTEDSGRELWQTDGTPDGTRLVKDINPGADSSSLLSLTNVNGTLFFSAFNPMSGTGLWKSDGTADGTRLVEVRAPSGDFAPLSPDSLTSFGGKVFFTAITGATGRELWQSDGTPEGTMPVQDINPGFANGFGGFLQPANLLVSNGKLFFSANDGRTGFELHVLVPPQVASVVLNDGSAQRLMVTSITVTFSEDVTIDPGAFELLLQEGNLVDLTVTTSVVGGKTVAVLTFTGADIIGGSLADGNYTLTIRADRIRDRLGSELDGDGDGRFGGDRVDTFIRLFGDSDGNGDVDELDRDRFRSTFKKRVGDPGYLSYFDFDGDGLVDGRDNGQFNLRFGQRRR